MPATTRSEEKRVKTTAFRFTQAEFDEILARAQARDMTMTEYVVRAALGELDVTSTVDGKFQLLEDRIERLERMADLGGLG